MLEPKGCFVAVRGTFGTISSLLDAAFWLTDFEQGICPGCQVVQGFHLAYLSIKDGLFRALQDFGCQQEPLYLVGHSQGRHRCLTSCSMRWSRTTPCSICMPSSRHVQAGRHQSRETVAPLESTVVAAAVVFEDSFGEGLCCFHMSPWQQPPRQRIVWASSQGSAWEH